MAHWGYKPPKIIEVQIRMGNPGSGHAYFWASFYKEKSLKSRIWGLSFDILKKDMKEMCEGHPLDRTIEKEDGHWADKVLYPGVSREFSESRFSSIPWSKEGDGCC